MYQRLFKCSLVFATTVFCLTSCGSDVQPEKRLMPDTSLSGGEAPVYEHPDMSTLEGKPQPFPSRYPLKNYPNSKVALAFVYPRLRPGETNQVMLKSSDKIGDIATYYRRDLTKEGWTLVSSYENIIYSSTIWQKGDQQIEVRVSPDPNNMENIQLFSGTIARRMPSPAPTR